MGKSMAEADRMARDCVNSHMWSSGIIGFVPGSTIVLTPKQWKMVSKIAEIYEVHSYDTSALVAALGSALAGKAASETLSLIPVIGWIAKGAVAAGITKACGEVIIEYMRDRSSIH